MTTVKEGFGLLTDNMWSTTGEPDFWNVDRLGSMCYRICCPFCVTEEYDDPFNRERFFKNRFCCKKKGENYGIQIRH